MLADQALLQCSVKTCASSCCCDEAHCDVTPYGHVCTPVHVHVHVGSDHVMWPSNSNLFLLVRRGKG